MKKKIVIDASFPSEIRVVLLDKNGNVENFELCSTSKKQIKGNIYLAKITRIEPSLQAAFVDYGNDKSGFLPFSEIHPDYYQTLTTDKQTNTLVGQALNSAEITSADLEIDNTTNNDLHKITDSDSDEIDIRSIEKMVDEKIQPQFDLNAQDDEIEPIEQKNHEVAEKHYKIHEVIKKGQILLVQATKEERGNKGASMTTYISLAGKYCVLMPNKGSQNGVSRKISHFDERKRIKKIIDDLVSKSNHDTFSVIARTAGIGCSSLELKKDYDYLARLWNKIRETTIVSTAPCFIHQEDGIILKTIRDMFDHTVQEIFIQGKSTYQDCVKFMSDILPHQISSVKEYKGKVPIFTKFAIETQLIKLYQPIVTLPSGGYIVINPTEALISIDVNSGRSTSERNIEETALKTNLEAAKEIAKQARLRDLSGLIVIDFIDLLNTRNKRILERSLEEYFSKDKARIQITNISTLGLLEMSRQRLRPSFLEMNSSMCTHCSGKGVIRADDANAMLILRTIENEIFNGSYDVVNVYGNALAIIYLLNNKRSEISFIEKKYNIKLNFHIDKDAMADNYSIEKIKLMDKQPIVDDAPALQDTSEIYNEPTDRASPQSKHNEEMQHTATTVQDNTVSNSENNALSEDQTPKNTTPTPKRYNYRNKKRIAKKRDNPKSSTPITS